MFSKKELAFIYNVLRTLTFKPGNEETYRLNEQILGKIQAQLKAVEGEKS